MTEQQHPTTLTEAVDEIRRWHRQGKTPGSPRSDSEWWQRHDLTKRIPHGEGPTDAMAAVGEWLATLVPAGTAAGDDRLSAVTRLLLSEVKAQSGHFGGPLERLLGDRVHDQRLRGECMTCSLIAIAEDALAGTSEDSQ